MDAQGLSPLSLLSGELLDHTLNEAEGTVGENVVTYSVVM